MQLPVARPTSRLLASVALVAVAALSGCATTAPGAAPAQTSTGAVPAATTTTSTTTSSSSTTSSTTSTAPAATTPAGTVATPAKTPAAPPTTPAQPTTSAKPATPAKPAVPPLGSLPLAERQKWAYSDDYSKYQGPHTGNTVMLTYDDCPTSYDSFKNTVLGAEKLGIRLALFPTGECLTVGNFDTKFARDHGAYVFNHSNTHPDFTSISNASIASELSKSVRSSWARPPFGSFNERVRAQYAEQGMRIWIWEVDTEDWKGHKSADAIFDEVIENSYPGAVVLMHMQEDGFSTAQLQRFKTALAKDKLTLCRNLGPAEQYPRTLAC